MAATAYADRVYLLDGSVVIGEVLGFERGIYRIQVGTQIKQVPESHVRGFRQITDPADPDRIGGAVLEETSPRSQVDRPLTEREFQKALLEVFAPDSIRAAVAVPVKRKAQTPAGPQAGDPSSIREAAALVLKKRLSSVSSLFGLGGDSPAKAKPRVGESSRDPMSARPARPGTEGNTGIPAISLGSETLPKIEGFQELMKKIAELGTRQ